MLPLLFPLFLLIAFSVQYVSFQGDLVNVGRFGRKVLQNSVNLFCIQLNSIFYEFFYLTLLSHPSSFPPIFFISTYFALQTYGPMNVLMYYDDELTQWPTVYKTNKVPLLGTTVVVLTLNTFLLIPGLTKKLLNYYTLQSHLCVLIK